MEFLKSRGGTLFLSFPSLCRQGNQVINSHNWKYLTIANHYLNAGTAFELKTHQWRSKNYICRLHRRYDHNPQCHSRTTAVEVQSPADLRTEPHMTETRIELSIFTYIPTLNGLGRYLLFNASPFWLDLGIKMR